jgi:hypothetical protein
MDLSGVRYFGLTLVEWATVIAVLVAIPPFIKALRRRKAEKSNQVGAPPVTVVVESPDGSKARGSRRGTADAIDGLTKAVIAAPIVHAVAKGAIDKFSDAALAHVAASTADAASQAAAEIGLASAVDALDLDSATSAADGSLVDLAHDVTAAIGKVIL